MTRPFWVLCVVTLAALGAAAIVSNLAARAQSRDGHDCIADLPVAPAVCSGIFGARRGTLQRSRRVKRPGQLLVYAAQVNGSAVSISALGVRGFAPAGVLSLGKNTVPWGLAVDAAQNLYVTIVAVAPPAVASVEVFAPSATQPSKVYTDGVQAPLDVAVDPHGTVYVANLTSIGADCSQRRGAGNVVEYAHGSMTPTAVIANIPGCPHAVFADAHSNLFVSYAYYGSGKVGLESDVREYSDGSTSGKRLHLDDPSRPAGYLLFGIAENTAGGLVVAAVDTNNSVNRLLTFAPGAHRATNQIAYARGWPCVYFALRGNRIFAPGYVSEYLNSAIAEFEYPSGRQRFVQNPAISPAVNVYGFAVAQGGS